MTAVAEPQPSALARADATRVVLIGAGFAGLEAAKHLAGKPGIHLTIIDRRNYHLFQPLLYQVATAGLDEETIAVPIRAQFARRPSVEVHLGDVDTIDLDAQVVTAGAKRVAFDYLIVASGASHSYFGHPEWEPFAPGLKTLEQAIEIRRRILLAFERAENERDKDAQAAWLTFVIVGGGPTGVELAGAIADIRRSVLTRDFRRIDPRSARIVLCQGGPRLIPQFREKLSAKAGRALGQLGVEVRTGTRVEHVDADGVLANQERIASRTVLWAAGVTGSALGTQLGVAVDRAGRVPVAPDLSVPGHPNVFVAGDLAKFEDPRTGMIPGLAQPALQGGRLAARNVIASMQGRARKTFHYHDKGMIATIGKHRAVAQLKHTNVTGYVAWWMWLMVHLWFLIGIGNRLHVLADFIWDYTFSKRGARVITARRWQLET
jgi:NADH dehydrogenase